MAISDLYGIGKGDAQVFDPNPLINLAQQERDYNRKRNAQKQAKRAVASAAIDTEFGKLKNTSWSEDQNYVKSLIDDTQQWMMDTYSKNGETSISESPELNREFKERLNFIKGQNDASHAQIKMGDDMLKRSKGNLDELDYETLNEWKSWRELPSEQRLVTPMPIIKDRSLELHEVVERDFRSEIDNLLVDVGYSGQTNDEGRYNNFKGKTINAEKLDGMISTLNSNPNSQVFKKADAEVKQEINSDLVPPTIINAQGVEVENPDYRSAIAKRRELKIRETIESKIAPEYMTSSARYAPGSDSNKVNIDVTEIEESEDKNITQEDIPESLKSGDYLSAIAKDGSGKKWFQIKTPMYEIEGKLYGKDEIPEGKTVDDGIYTNTGTWVDMEQNPRKDGKGLTEIKIKTKIPVDRKTTITTSSKPKDVTIKTIIKEDGTEDTGKDKTIKGVLTGHYEKDGKMVAQMTTKEGIIETPLTDAIKKAFPKEWEKIQESGKKARGKSLSEDKETPDKYGING